MKIIFNKQARKMAKDLRLQIDAIFKKHGKSIKLQDLLKLEYKIYISLGGKKDKWVY